MTGVAPDPEEPAALDLQDHAAAGMALETDAPDKLLAHGRPPRPQMGQSENILITEVIILNARMAILNDKT
jgi:hypothetical protein